MAKLIPDAILDQELDIFAAATIFCICSDTPTTYANMTATYDLATHVVAPADFSKAAGDTSGRKLILAAQNGISVDHSGTATHYGLGISGTSTLLLVGTLTSQVLTAGNTVNFPATDVNEVRALA